MKSAVRHAELSKYAAEHTQTSRIPRFICHIVANLFHVQLGAEQAVCTGFISAFQALTKMFFTHTHTHTHTQKHRSLLIVLCEFVTTRKTFNFIQQMIFFRFCSVLLFFLCVCVSVCVCVCVCVCVEPENLIFIYL